MMRAVTALLLVIYLALPISAQETNVRTIPFEGAEIFCHFLFSEAAKPIEFYPHAIDDPEHSVIIVLGKVTVRGLNNFVKNGGSVLIASDYRYDANDLPIRITGESIETPKEFSYNGQSQCPWLTYTQPNGSPFVFRDFRGHPYFRFLQKGIATNCPSRMELTNFKAGLHSLLEYEGIDIGRGRPQSYMLGSPKDAPPSGRALYIAGQGMFLNGMMAQLDNDNAQFTVNAIRWLRETADKDQPRNVLLIIDGTIITDFDKKLTPPPPPIPIPPLQAINRLLRGLEQERFFHRALESALGDRLGQVCAVVFTLFSLVMVLYGAKKFMESRQHLETGVPRMVGPPSALAAKTPMQHRQQSLLQKIDFEEEAHALAQDWFRRELDLTPSRWRAEVEAEFQATGGFWSSWRLQRRADLLLKIARSTGDMRVSRHQFFVFVESLRELSAALKDGRLELLVEGEVCLPFSARSASRER